VRKILTEVRGLLAPALFSASLLSSLAWGDQPSSIPRIGILNPIPSSTLEEGLHEGIQRAGYVEGRTILLEWRRSTGTEEELRSLAIDLTAAKVDLIVAIGSPAARAALQVTTVPVVFLSGDPVRAGFAASLAKPGGNGTGVSVLTPELEPKRMELLHLLVPQARRIGELHNPSNPLASLVATDLQTAARTLGLQLEVFNAPTVRGLDAALDALRRNPPDALIVSTEAFFLTYKAKIAQAVRKAKIPAIFPYREYGADGALMSYGPNLQQIGRLLAVYVDKVLRGAKPADLPIEQMSKYELVIDLRIAREMGVQVPQQLLLRADEVIR
jgi:putative ABC transport system substrate-binding protein